MMQIPDAAVQAATKELSRIIHEWDRRREFLNVSPKIKADFIRNSASEFYAALPHLQLGFDVKPLEWAEVTIGGNDRQAKCELGEYVISVDSFLAGSTHYLWVAGQQEDDEYHSEFRTMREAKAAAQADFDRRVRECLVTKPVAVAAVRRQALEEAATLIDEGFDKPVGKAWRNDGKPSKNDKCPHDKFMYEDCEHCASAAIRALSAEPAQGENISVPEAAEVLRSENNMRAIQDACEGICRVYRFCDVLDRLAAPTSEAEA